MKFATENGKTTHCSKLRHVARKPCDGLRWETSKVNPLHLSGWGCEIQAANTRAHQELMITDGRRDNCNGERYLFTPRQCPHDAIIVEAKTGHISLQAMRWLSANNIPVFIMNYDGSIISSLLPPIPVKADVRIAQIKTASDPKKSLTIAKALFQAKITRSLQILGWLAEAYDIEVELQATKREVMRVSEASTVPQLRTVEGRVALRYWQTFRKVLPKELHFQGRGYDGKNRNATDPFNAALNYGYGFLQCECRKAVNTVGLETSIGFSHTTTEWQTKESLVLDLEEPFRWLVDLCVIQAFQDSALNVSDFAWDRDDYRYRIEWEGRRRFLEILRETFHSPVKYKGQALGWDSVIEQKCDELARYLTGKTPTIDFSEPGPILERTDKREIREAILALTQSEANGLGIGKSELHYLRRKAASQQGFKLYKKIKEKMTRA